ncbi:hypothetical protein GCM10022233_66990 [Streptomyces shaanxiensis]|uniref:Uncharacterized protein n=1 Tax=Streptomyces shaanxiensis TaxID=653357 RepID=A0ABP7W067_9ACTN
MAYDGDGVAGGAGYRGDGENGSCGWCRSCGSYGWYGEDIPVLLAWLGSGAADRRECVGGGRATHVTAQYREWSRVSPN